MTAMLYVSLLKPYDLCDKEAKL